MRKGAATAFLQVLLLLLHCVGIRNVGASAIGRLYVGSPQIHSNKLLIGAPPGGYDHSANDPPVSNDAALWTDPDVPYRDYRQHETNTTDSCLSHWRLSYVVSACSKSQSADQLVFALRHHPIQGRTIFYHLKTEFGASMPSNPEQVVSHEVLQGQYTCLNRTSVEGRSVCQCGCDRIVRLHFAMEVPISADVAKVGDYIRDTVVSHMNSVPGICASEIDTYEGKSTEHSRRSAKGVEVPTVRFGSPHNSAVTFRRVLTVPGSQSPVVASSQCRHGDWRTSFDSMGWSTCPPTALFMNGLFRSQWGHGAVSEAIAMLDRVQCCEAPLSYKEMPTAYQSIDWSSSFKQAGWSLCPPGYFLHGMYRSSYSSKAGLEDIEAGRCAKPANHPLQHGDCYDEDVSQVFNSPGWASCSKGGYYVAGLYRNSNDRLRDIDLLRCCSMIEEQGHHPDLVQQLHSSAITASSCYSDFSSEGMHPILGKKCTTRGYGSQCLKFKRPAECVAEALVLGDTRPVYQPTTMDGPYVVVDLGTVRDVEQGVLFGRGDRAPYQKVTKFMVFTKQRLDAVWEAVGGIRDTGFQEFSHADKHKGSPFVVDRHARFFKVQAVECNKQCALRLQLFERSALPDAFATQSGNGTEPEQQQLAGSNPTNLEMWTCPT